MTISNPLGSATNTYIYTANGAKLSVTKGTFTTDFVGNKIYEKGLNLYDYEARYMEAALGRFMTMNPHAENYYSLMGSIYKINSFEGKVMKKIDEALVNNYMGSKTKYDQYGELIYKGCSTKIHESTL